MHSIVKFRVIIHFSQKIMKSVIHSGVINIICIRSGGKIDPTQIIAGVKLPNSGEIKIKD